MAVILAEKLIQWDGVTIGAIILVATGYIVWRLLRG